MWASLGFGTDPNVSKLGQSQANWNGDKINEKARANTETILC
jgi:hypothetical protein